MTNFAPKLGVGERARESRDEGADATSTATARRPAAPAPSAPSPSSSGPITAAPSEGEIGPRAAGFTSVIRHLSLRGWLWWIHSSRSNATLQVRAPDGGGGKIWCTRGDVIDAEWGGRVAEEALGDMLLLESGTVTVDFDRFERRRRIVRSTRELLQVADGEPSLATEAAHAEAVLAASPTGKVRSEPFRQSILFATGNLPLPAAASRQPKPQRRRLSRGEYLAVVFGVTALALAGFTFGRLRATNDQARMGAAEQPVTQQKRSGL